MQILRGCTLVDIAFNSVQGDVQKSLEEMTKKTCNIPSQCLCILLILFLQAILALHADEPGYGMSGNPGAVNILTGTGEFGRWLKIPKNSGYRLGGLWIGDYNALVSGVSGRRLTGNNLVILDFSIDMHKAFGWKGAYFGTEFLQFNGQSTNADAGVVQGYNGLTEAPPLNRSELYQLWILQQFFHDKLSVRVGKTIPIYHFNNVSKPVPKANPLNAIPSVSGLIYTPIFVNTTLLGAIGGYYNSVYGIVVTIAPNQQAYANIGVFDGNLARGVQTGLKGPHFNGYYFSIMEVGYGWKRPKPGIAAIGGWYQSGLLKGGGQKQNGTGGIYAFGSRALWMKEPRSKNKGNVSSFFQFGWNQSKTLPMNLFFGMGATAFALVDKRPNDSFGIGIAWSRLNKYLFSRRSEWMFQGYYQMQLYNSLYFQPVVSYIPNPGAHPTKSNVCALTARLTALF